MSELTPLDEALLGRARQGLDPTGEDQARVKRGLLTKMGVAAAGATAAMTASSEAAAAGATGTAGAATATVGGVSLVTKLVVVLVAAGGLAGGAAVMSRDAARTDPAPKVLVHEGAPVSAATSTAPVAVTRSPVAPLPAPATAAAASVGASPTSTPTARSLGTATAAPASPAPQAREPAAGPSTVAAEAAMLAEADGALRAGDATRALERLDAHRQTFPRGVMAEEREAERVVVLCALGRTDEAHAARDAFVRERPRSPLVGRVMASCATP